MRGRREVNRVVCQGCGDKLSRLMMANKATVQRMAQAAMATRCLSRSCAKTLRLISRTASKPSLPRMAFCLKRSTVKSSMLFLIFCQPPQRATTWAFWSKMVREWGAEDEGL